MQTALPGLKKFSSSLRIINGDPSHHIKNWARKIEFEYNDVDRFVRKQSGKMQRTAVS